MAYSGGKEIDNSFNLSFVNVSGGTETINLFELGSEGVKVPEPFNLQEKGATLLSTYFTAAYVFDSAQNAQGLLTNDDITLTENTNWTITQGTVSRGSIITTGQTLSQVNASLNTNLDSAGSEWDGVRVQLVFDFASYQKNKEFQMLLYVFYNKDEYTYTGGRVSRLRFTSAGKGTNDIDDINDEILQNVSCTKEVNDAGATIGTPAVVIKGRNGITYETIKESQNGQVLDIKTINFQVNPISTATDLRQQQQTTYCFTFEKKDINGNRIEYKKCPVIDTFSNPSINAIDDIQLERKADVYTLDGTTNFEYTLRSGAVVILGAEYTKLTNLLQQSEEGQEIIQVEKKNIKKNRLNTEYALTKELITAEEKEKENEFNFSGSVKKKAPQIYYATASYCLEELLYSCY
jgi:hypothetical protein